MDNNNEFKFELNYVNDALLCSKRAASYLETFDLKLNNINRCVSNIKYPLFLFDTNLVMNWVNEVRSMENTIVSAKHEAMMAMISMGTFEENTVNWINNNEITADEIVDFAEFYMKKLYLTPNYTSRLWRVSSLNQLLDSKKISREFVEELNRAISTKIINNNEMYTREGIVTLAYTFCGLYAMFGATLDYDLGSSFDSYESGFYYGTKDRSLRMLDCCNLNDWLFRGVGLDVHQGGADTMYKYGIDIEQYGNKTPEKEYYARSDDEYFRNARPGDIMLNGNHTRMILERTDTGYITIEECGCLKIQHYTFEELAKYQSDENKDYKICNMDALYRNTSATEPRLFSKNIHNVYMSDVSKDREIRNTGVFFHPDELRKQLNMDEKTYNNMLQQFNSRNQNPYTKIMPIKQESVDAITLEYIDFDINTFETFDESKNYNNNIK